MPTVYAGPEAEPINEVRVQIGRDWIAHHFGKPVTREQAMERARVMLESLK